MHYSGLYRFLKFYPSRNKKIGTTQRNSMLACDTCMTLFKDEVDAQSEAVLQYSGQLSSYIDICYVHDCNIRSYIASYIYLV